MLTAALKSIIAYVTTLPGNYSCFSFGNCTQMYLTNTFGLLLFPYQWTLGDFAPVAIWGILTGIIWFRTQNIMMIGIVGLAINASLVTFYPPARQMGWILLLIAIGVVLYQLFTNRIRHGSSV